MVMPVILFIVSGPLRFLFQNPRRILRHYVKPGLTVLDIGCGAGFFSLGMARLVGSGGRVICVDVRAEAIESVNERAAGAGLSEIIETRRCSDSDLEIDDLAGRIDFALAFYVVHHAEDVPRLMEQVQGALKRGGTFLIVEPGHHASAEACRAVETRARQAGLSPVEHPKLVRDWAVLLVKD